MAENKKSFILYADYIHLVKKMPPEKAGLLFVHILEYVNDLNPVTDDLIIDLSFEPIKQQLKRDLRRYEDKKIQYSEAGKASAAKKKLEKEINERSTKSTNVDERSTKSTVTVNDTVNVNVTVNDNESEQVKKSFSPISHTFELTIDECKKQYILDDILIESVCMNLKRTNVEILALLDSFTTKLITEGVQSKTLIDFKSHFMRWAKIQTSIKAMDQSQPTLKKKYL